MNEAEGKTTATETTTLEEYIHNQIQKTVESANAFFPLRNKVLANPTLDKKEQEEIEEIMIRTLRENSKIANLEEQWKPVADRMLKTFEDRLKYSFRGDMDKTITDNFIPVSDDEFDLIRKSVMHDGERMLEEYDIAVESNADNPFDRAMQRSRWGTMQDAESTSEEESSWIDNVIDMVIPFDEIYDMVNATVNANVRRDDRAEAIESAENMGKTAYVDYISGAVLGKVFKIFWKKCPKPIKEKLKAKTGQVKAVLLKRIKECTRISSAQSKRIEVQPKKSILEQEMERAKAEGRADDVDDIWNQIKIIRETEALIDFPYSHLKNKSIRRMKSELSSLSREEKRNRIKEIREVVEYSQRVGIHVIKLIEMGLHEAQADGSRLAMQNTESYQHALRLAQNLPTEYRQTFQRKVSDFSTLNKLLSRYEGRDSEQIFQEIFGVKPLTPVQSHIGDTAIDFDVSSTPDYINAIIGREKRDYYNGNREALMGLAKKTKKTDGFAARRNKTPVSVSRNPDDPSVRQHENQHVRHEAIADKALHPKNNLSREEVMKMVSCPQEDLIKVVLRVLIPELEKALDWVKDEALAYTKNGYRGHVVLKLGDKSLYDYTLPLRKGIESALRSRANTLRNEADKKATMAIADDIHAGFMQEYLRVAENLVSTASSHSDKLDLLSITPYQQWWRIRELGEEIGERSDFVMNYSRFLTE